MAVLLNFVRSTVRRGPGPRAQFRRVGLALAAGALTLLAGLQLSSTVGAAAAAEAAEPSAPVEPGAPTSPLPPPETPASTAAIEGFRQARFGMTEEQLRQAIRKDFPAS